MGAEEGRLFPACRTGIPIERGDIAAFEDEHAAAGVALERLHGPTGGYDLDAALRNAHRATLDGLHELALDLHLHIHEENGVLFSRALDR